jgi:hypothetical protein
VLGFLPTIIWGGYFFDASRNYKTRSICLEPELALDSILPDKTLLLGIFHREYNIHVHIFSDCRGPCDYLCVINLICTQPANLASSPTSCHFLDPSSSKKTSFLSIRVVAFYSPCVHSCICMQAFYSPCILTKARKMESCRRETEFREIDKTV